MEQLPITVEGEREASESVSSGGGGSEDSGAASCSGGSSVGGYCGHFVVVLGFIEGFAVVHNPDGFMTSHGAGFLIPEHVFDKARLAKGTDEVSCPHIAF